MERSSSKKATNNTVKVVHDLKRQILEIPSLIRVMNNYYYKKNQIQNQIKPILLKKFKENLKILKDKRDWLHSIPTALDTLSDDLISRKDSFKFPDSIILFEAWMNLGDNALYPKLALHYKFPGFLKGEKTRHLFQFIFSTSRGFGFPIYFGPRFYGYMLTYGKVLEPIFKWSHTVCHRANQAIYLVGRRYNVRRHHPGEFESIIISEYKDNLYKGIDTLLHGYFTKDPKNLGKFSSLKKVLQNITFSYSIGDHAMSIESKPTNKIMNVKLITYDKIMEEYNVDFYTYIKELISFKKILINKILFYKDQKASLKNQLSKLDKLKLFLNRSKRFKVSALKSSKSIFEIEKINLYIHVMEEILELIWTTPLYTHTLHVLTNKEKKFLIQDKKSKENFEQKSIDSIFLLFLKFYEQKYNFNFEEKDILKKVDDLRDLMAKMWLYFKERQFNLAIQELSELSKLSIEDQNYDLKVNEILNKLIPIFSIYEIFNRSLSESVYPESIPHTERLGAYIASFLTSRYNPFGVNLMHLFNRLSFYNWSYFIVKNKLNRKKFYNFILKLPIWKNIPQNIKLKILKI
ncbi:MAG: hypothetical protein ACFFBZ_02320 [Promethearchaeota archaeon]